MTEPVLRDDDRAAWATLEKTARVHAQTLAHRRAVEIARSLICRALALEQPDRWCAMWSGGKDSTVMVHLLRGLGVPVASEKDDLDYPGEREYVERLAREWGLVLTVLVPEVSPLGWIAEHRNEIEPGGDIHSRTAELSKQCFYSVVEAHTKSAAGIFLGLRAQESRGRAMNRATRGSLYKREGGQLVCSPLSDWSGLDVFAYAFTQEIELLPVYRCIGLQNIAEPWRVRKSWWLPGESARFGGVIWLRRYWPSLHSRMVAMLPGAARLS